MYAVVYVVPRAGSVSIENSGPEPGNRDFRVTKLAFAQNELIHHASGSGSLDLPSKPGTLDTKKPQTKPKSPLESTEISSEPVILLKIKHFMY